MIEALETRALLSVDPTHRRYAAPIAEPYLPGGFKDSGASPFGYSGSTSPYRLYFTNQVVGCYALGSYTSQVLSDGLTFGKTPTPGDGRGETIAIVDAYDYPMPITT